MYSCATLYIHNYKNCRQNEKQNNKERDNKRQKIQCRFVRNPLVHPEWHIRPDERYGTAFHPHIHHIPKKMAYPFAASYKS